MINCVGDAGVVGVVDQGRHNTCELRQRVGRDPICVIVECRRRFSTVLKVQVGRGHHARQEFYHGHGHVTCVLEVVKGVALVRSSNAGHKRVQPSQDGLAQHD